MHLYFLTRGIKQQTDLFEMFMQTQMFKWKRKNLKTGKEEVVQVQGALRPIQLYEYVFPEECYDELMTTIENFDSVERKGFWKLPKAVVFGFRKLLGHGVKPIKKWKVVPTNKYVEKKGVAIYPIGIKDDKRTENKIWGYEQEML